MAAPRVDVKLKASRTCFLSAFSDKQCFYLVLLLTLRNSKKPVVFLKDGFSTVQGLQSINSGNVVQCFDEESGEQVPVLRQGEETHPSFLLLEPNRSGYITFTTSNTLRSYELPFLASSLQPGKRYRLCFKPTSSITHWPSSLEASLKPLSEIPSSSIPAMDIPDPSTTDITWNVVSGDDTIVFAAQREPPQTPKVTVTRSAPSTFSLSRNPPFTYTLTFSTDAPHPITVLAERELSRDWDLDIELHNPASGRRLRPDVIDFDLDGPWAKEDFLRIDGTYTERRELDLRRWGCVEEALKVGEEYVLRYRGETWPWWTEDTIDEVMTYAGDRGGSGLSQTETIRVSSAGELRFKVVE